MFAYQKLQESVLSSSWQCSSSTSQIYPHTACTTARYGCPTNQKVIYGYIDIVILRSCLQLRPLLCLSKQHPGHMDASRPAEAYTARIHHCTFGEQPTHTYVTHPARRGVCISCVRYTGVTSSQLLCICHPGAEAVCATLRASIIPSSWSHTYGMLFMHAQPQGESTAPQQCQPSVLMLVVTQNVIKQFQLCSFTRNMNHLWCPSSAEQSLFA
jgi:hypothetical protein